MEEHKDLSFIAGIEAYEKHCFAEGMSVSTVRNKVYNITFFFRWCLAEGVYSLSAVTKALAEQYKAYLASYVSPHTKRPLKKSTRRKLVSDLRVLFVDLTYLEYFDVNPLQQLRLPKSPRPMVTALLSEEEVQRVMNETKGLGLKGLRDRAILECYYATAGRRKEIGQLTLEDIKFDKDQVLIVNGKGDKTRYTPLAKRPASWLKAYHQHVRPKLACLKSGTTFFLDNYGLPFRTHQLSALVKKYLVKAGINVGAACNAFRHSAATHMLENGADIREIQEYLGHADLSTTQVYVHVTQTQLKKVYNRTHPAARKGPIKKQDIAQYLR